MEKYSVTMVIISAVVLAGFSSGIGMFTESAAVLFFGQILFTFTYKSCISLFAHYTSIPNKMGRIALFGAWYLLGLGVSSGLSFLWPNLNPVWFVAQQLFIFQGIRGILWRGSIGETMSWLPLMAYFWISLGTVLMAFSSNFTLHYFQSTIFSPLNRWMMNSIPYFFPLLLQGALIMYLASKSQPPVRMRRGVE